MSVWPLSSCVFRKGQVCLCPFELRVPWDGVLNNLFLFLHQPLELGFFNFFLYSRRLRHDWFCSTL